MTAGLLLAVLIAGYLPKTGAWVDPKVIWRTTHCQSHQECLWQHRAVSPQSRWRYHLPSAGSVNGVAVVMAAASDAPAENTTMGWSMDVQLTSEAIGANSTAAKAAASGTRRRRLQGGKITSRRTGTSKSDEASEGGQGAGIEQPEEEDKQRKQTRQQKRQQEEEGAPVPATAVVPEDVNSIDRESGEGASKRVKGEARLRPRRRATPARAAAAAAAEAPPPAPPPEPEEDVASPAVHEQPLAVASGEAGRGKVGDKVEDGAKATAGAAATSKKPAATRGRGFGKKAPAPEPAKSGGGGGSETVEFTRIIKMLKLKPDEYAMARRVVEEVFGPEEAKPWLQELEAAALSQGVSIPETESKVRIQRPALEASTSGAKRRSAPAQEDEEEEKAEEREEEVVAAAPASPVVDVVIAKEKAAEPPLKAREEIRDGEEVTLPMEKLGLRRRMPYKASAAPPPPAKAEEREGGAGSRAPRAGRGEGKGAPGRRRGGAGRDEEEPEMDEEKLLDSGGAAGEDEEEVDEEEDAEALKENVDEAVFRDKRVVATHIKDAKLSEYIKDKKNSRTTRDKFLADVGMVRAEVHPPQRFVEVYYNNWADDFYTAITTSSNRFGPRWWFREALSHGPTEVLAWLRHWYRMAKKHGVLHDSVGRMLSDALKDTLEGESGIGARTEMQRYGALKDRMRKWREPRIIAIGDVHGCIDEVRALIKKVEYSPGDLVIFLGDLVAKGPDSVEVVRLAREIGALSVRGNHENEVIKWSRAMALGAQSNFKSEHYLIALGLSEEDIEWLRSLPWYISCSDLQLLFVHAGFVSNLRLSKQHPRFMINMRSILSDGTVSARYYQDYPWARTWTGPQTVLFGHDARRGMQQYDQALGLDTGCVYGGNLTACIMPGRQYVQVKAAEAYIVHRYERIMRRAETLKESIMRDSLD